MASLSTYIRQLTIQDLEECHSVEAAAFPPAEAATWEKIATSTSAGDQLLAHIIATRSGNSTVKDEDMAYPQDWRSSSTVDQSIGHQPGGRTITLHSLAVLPRRQRSGLGKALMTAYIKHFQSSGTVDRISILTYERLVPYYKGLGFKHLGRSESEYAGIAWHDLTYYFEG
ncbi:hypothetical protein S40293_08063 [Stachybotrys chartarum IBT 40293]|nr:hypothetical protein S40293_08063 [Stachybotrys chartarum IBT 40293]